MVSPVGGGSRVRQRYSGRKRYLQWESTAKCERLHPKLLNYYTVENRRWRWRQFSPGERDWERCICVYEGKARKIVCKETIKHHLISRISSALKSKIIYYFLARGVLVKKVDKHRCEPITQSRGAGLLVQRSRTAYKSWQWRGIHVSCCTISKLSVSVGSISPTTVCVLLHRSCWLQFSNRTPALYEGYIETAHGTTGNFTKPIGRMGCLR